MAYKFTAFVTLCFAAANAGILAPFAAVAPAPLAAAVQVEEYDAHPQYTYGYDVKDTLSGDSKTAVETRDGGFVQGQYSLNDADGYRRIVDYISDPVNGFNAVVRREPLVAPVVATPAPVAAPSPVVAAGPAHFVSAPGVVKTHFASPLISYSF